MRKLYEIFKVLKIQKITVSAETIRGNTVIWRDNIKVLEDCLYNIHFCLGKLHYILAIELLPSFMEEKDPLKGRYTLEKIKMWLYSYVIF